MRYLNTVLILVVTLLLTVSCNYRSSNLGTSGNPVKVAFMPRGDVDNVTKGADLFARQLEAETDLKVKTVISEDYISIIDGLHSGKIDLAIINPLGYLLARDWAGATAIYQLKGPGGRSVFKSAIITNHSSGINSIKDMDGKSIAYTNPYSVSGYFMPLVMLDKYNVTPSEIRFSGSFEDVIKDVYSGKISAGAIFYNESGYNSHISKALENSAGGQEKSEKSFKILALSDPIPTSPVVIRDKLGADVKSKLMSGLAKISAEQTTVKGLQEMYDSTGLAAVNEADFNRIEDVLAKQGRDIKETVPGALTFYKTHMWDEVPEP